MTNLYRRLNPVGRFFFWYWTLSPLTIGIAAILVNLLVFDYNDLWVLAAIPVYVPWLWYGIWYAVMSDGYPSSASRLERFLNRPVDTTLPRRERKKIAQDIAREAYVRQLEKDLLP